MFFVKWLTNGFWIEHILSQIWLLVCINFHQLYMSSRLRQSVDRNIIEEQVWSLTTMTLLVKDDKDKKSIVT